MKFNKEKVEALKARTIKKIHNIEAKIKQNNVRVGVAISLEDHNANKSKFEAEKQTQQLILDILGCIDDEEKPSKEDSPSAAPSKPTSKKVTPKKGKTDPAGAASAS